MQYRIVARWVVPAVALVLLSITCFAADDDEKPFAEDRVVLQLSESGDAEQRLVLSIANNLIKHYGGPDFIDIEIVAFGPGISLLFKGSQHAERISSLVANGVRFVGCLNTIETLARRDGKAPEMSPVMIPVQTGVAHIIQRANEGFTVIRP